MLRFALAAALVFVAAQALAADSPEMQEGQWEVAVEMEMPGMPMKMPPVVQSQCMTQDDRVPHAQRPGDECQSSNTRIAGNTVAWEIQCKSRDGSTTHGTGTAVYRGDTFDGHIDMTMNHGGQAMKMRQKLSGKRIGECTAGAK
jgi:hypothetical protein